MHQFKVKALKNYEKEETSTSWNPYVSTEKDLDKVDKLLLEITISALDVKRRDILGRVHTAVPS